MGTGATSGRRATGAGYLFANCAGEALTRMAALSALFDRGTVRHLKGRGVGRGGHCLEVGAGGGTIARWLAARVGPTGRVLATDVDPRFLLSLNLPNLEVRRHDIATDPLPPDTFDLVHARLVLMHLPRREEALGRMIAALKPGAWLVLEEFDSASGHPDPATSPGEVLLETQLAMSRFLEERGVDRRYGRRLLGRLRAHRLTSIGAEARMFLGERSSPGAALLRANLDQLREALIGGNYVTPRQFADDRARLDELDVLVPSPILWSAWGRRG